MTYDMNKLEERGKEIQDVKMEVCRNNKYKIFTKRIYFCSRLRFVIVVARMRRRRRRRVVEEEEEGRCW